jgi:predicted dehydrogenase
VGKSGMIAVIGCGAIAERFHLPALARRGWVGPRLMLVDPDEARTGRLAREYGDAASTPTHLDILDRIDGAIVAVPHRLHHDIVLDCLRAGTSVLCEKPLASDARAARDLVEAAAVAGAQLAVNNTRRLFPSYREVANLIRLGHLGTIRELEFEDGDRFDWPAASGDFFGTRSEGRGVLLDIGAHVLDAVCWWLGARPEILDYQDDALGGSEAVAEVQIGFGTGRGTVRLSWLSKLGNHFRVEGDLATVTGEVYDWRGVTLERRGAKPRRVPLPSTARTFTDFAADVVGNFLDVVQGKGAPLVSGRDVLPSLELIDGCYQRRRRFAMPWHDRPLEAAR